MLPDGEVLTDAVLLKDAADVINVDGWDAGLSNQLVGDATRVGLGVTLCYVNAHLLDKSSHLLQHSKVISSLVSLVF